MPKIARALLTGFPGLSIVHQAGGRHGVTTGNAYEAAGVSGDLLGRRVRVQPYLDGMVEEIAAADLVLCRSGASTVAELAAAGRPSVLVPFAAAADDHQRRNAEVMVRAGAARMICEDELAPERALEELSGLLGDRNKLLGMGTSARTLSYRYAAAEIAELSLGLSSRGWL